MSARMRRYIFDKFVCHVCRREFSTWAGYAAHLNTHVDKYTAEQAAK